MRGFDHERLEVYEVARQFTRWLRQLLRKAELQGWNVVADQLRRTSVSISLNNAEGSGEFAPGEKNRFFRMAKRSATESAAALDFLVDVGVLEEADIRDGKDLLHRIVSMLVRLIQTNERPRSRLR